MYKRQSLVEPNAPLPSQRLKAMNTLAKKGFHVGVALMLSLIHILYCLGFGLTLLVLGYIISSMDISRFAKKPEHIQKIFAILIIIGAIYMLITALGGIL